MSAASQSVVSPAMASFVNIHLGLAVPNLLTQKTPLCNVIGYHHLGVAVTDVQKSLDFYFKIGFKEIPEKSTSSVKVVANRGGLECHLFHSDKGLDDPNCNLLMDYPTQKWAGHTHASFSVPNVQSTAKYFENVGLAVSGERKHEGVLKAIFTRDPDRTTFEFERNFGEPLDEEVTASSIGYPQCLDHVGIRVTKPLESIIFYAENFGFIQEISKYEPNPIALKNFAPWITRTPTRCDINFIINANIESKDNVLVNKEEVRPGIVYVGFTVDDLAKAETNLRAAGLEVYTEVELATSRIGRLAEKIIFTHPDGRRSLFVLDHDSNVIRLVDNK